MTPTRETAKPSAIVDSLFVIVGLPALIELWNDGQRFDSAALLKKKNIIIILIYQLKVKLT